MAMILNISARRPPLPVGISPARGEIGASPFAANRISLNIIDLPPCGGDADRQRGAPRAKISP